jgi:hypothetical protein
VGRQEALRRGVYIHIFVFCPTVCEHEYMNIHPPPPPPPPPRLSRLVTALNLISVNALFFLEQFKAFKQAMIKHSQAQDDYKVPSFISPDKRG